MSLSTSVVRKEELLKKPVYPVLRILETTAIRAKKRAKEIYPGMDPVVINKTISDFERKFFFEMEIRPPAQKGIGDF